MFEALGIETGRSFERSRTHWAVKDVDLFEVTTRLLHQAGNVPVVLTTEEMNQVWGEGRRRKKLVFLSHRAAYRRQVARVREQMDVAFREGQSRVRRDRGPRNMAALRQVSHNLLKRDTGLKVGIQGKRMQAGWREDCLLKVLLAW